MTPPRLAPLRTDRKAIERAAGTRRATSTEGSERGRFVAGAASSVRRCSSGAASILRWLRAHAILSELLIVQRYDAYSFAMHRRAEHVSPLVPLSARAGDATLSCFLNARVSRRNAPLQI